MNDLGLSSLTNIHVIGQFGNHLTALSWLTITATLMYAGPATVSLVYLLFFDHPRVSTQVTTMDRKEEEFEQLKAA